MSVVPPRQVAILSIASPKDPNNASARDTHTASGTHTASTNANAANAASPHNLDILRDLAQRCGVKPGHMRSFGEDTLLIRLDDLPREEFLATIRRMVEASRDLSATLSAKAVPTCDDPSPAPLVRVGAMSEKALRSFVDTAASNLLSYMDHANSTAAFLAGDEIDVWQSLESTGIEFLSHEQLAGIDPFTGLLKEERFFQLLQHVIDHRELYEGDVTVLYLDIDDFKSYNRTYDHESGDMLLRFVAHTIEREFPTDVVAHISVDRFAVITQSPDVVRKCAAIHERVRNFRESFAPQVKCGAFVLEEGVRTAHIALDCAKIACESIKGRYDVTCRFFDDDLRERLFARRYVAHNAERAVADGWIRAYAQPVVDAHTGATCGFEALARWDDPTLGILSPALFIPTLEDTHLIHKLDLCIVEQVCAYLAERLAPGGEVPSASVNLSRIDFEQCDVVTLITELCERHGIPHDLLAVEITESALDGSSDLKREIGRFRTAGFEVWMDDFGCGYSSLNLLKDYEFDVLKVDMEFLRDLENNERSKTIVSSVIAMAKSLGIRTLVEGVETAVQRDFLLEAGCDMMQGYYFGRPLPLALP